ncbi:MAG: hypothetical protein AAB538_00295 [Patescibacteria group bacterium]
MTDTEPVIRPEDFSGTLENYLRRKFGLPTTEDSQESDIRIRLGPFPKEGAPTEEEVAEHIKRYYAQPSAPGGPYEFRLQRGTGLIYKAGDGKPVSIAITVLSQSPNEVVVQITIVKKQD